MLIGRSVETARLDGLIERIRHGRGEALALEGEPGAGKTMLLEYAVEHADGLAVLRASGVPSETQISFSGLSELLRPVLSYLPELPEPQASALAGALALGPPTGGDRFAVYAATLNLLARVAQDQAVLVVVDDAHWLDTASGEALRFAARRLGDEPVGVLFALRPGEFETSGLRVFTVAQLSRDASLALLPAGVAATVAEELLRAAAGNPLALVELPTLLTPGQLEGREPLHDPLRAGARAERAFLSRFAGLPAPTRTALLVAAASGSRAIESVVSSMTVMGLDATALEAAESAGLVRLDGVSLHFRHPLVRSCVYHGASAAERRAAHRALATALDGSTDGHAAVRRAWHLAAAALGPDAQVAAELDAAAEDARERTGYSAAALAFERAAELTVAGDDRARRILRAADTWQLAGRPARSVELIDATLPSIEDPLLRATAHHLGGRIDVWRGPAAEAKDRLVAEAARIAPAAPELAARMLADAVTGCVAGGSIAEAVRIGRQAYEAAAPLGGNIELLAALQLGKALILNGEREGDPLIMRCVELMDGDDPLWLAMELAHCAPALMTIEEYDLARALLTRLIAAARAGGAFGPLTYCLGALAELDVRVGHWTAAYAGVYESIDLAREAGQMGQLSYNLARLAWLEAAQGREDDCRAHAQEAVELAAAFDFTSSLGFAEYALGLLALGSGQPEVAADRLEFKARKPWDLVEPNRLDRESDLIEASVRTGRLDVAERALDRLEEAVARTERPMSLGALNRARGQIAADDRFAAFFEAALAWYEKSRTPFERARTHLLFGERLRRARRRTEARSQLRAAVDAFDRLGARPWADRARSELRASGEAARKRDVSSTERLTAQELQVGRLVAEGATNREAAAALFVSPKTIEAHLYSAYRKLGIRSRTELAMHLAGREAAAA